MVSRKYTETNSLETIFGNVWLISFILLGLSCTAQSTPTLKWFKNTTSDYLEYTLDNTTAVLTTDYYNSEQNITLYVYGFTQTANSSDVLSVAEEYLNLNDRLLVLLQYDDEANTYLSPLLNSVNASTIVINYPLVVLATKGVYEALGNALCDLYNAGVDLKRFHLVGHSLGAHIVGNAGRTLKTCTNGTGVDRATGLDPASYGFQEPLIIVEPIGTDSADFVDIIHTDPSGFGNKNSLGHCDFWVNDAYYQEHHYQPGCASSISCSHGLSVDLWKEAIANSTVLVASGDGNTTTYIGDNTNRTASGSYYFCTNDESPYAKGAAGANSTECST